MNLKASDTLKAVPKFTAAAADMLKKKKKKDPQKVHDFLKLLGILET